MSRRVKRQDNNRSRALSDYMNNNFVYFVTHVITDHVRVGFTTSTWDRLRSHAQAGFDGTKVIVPGTYENEQSRHKLLGRFKEDYGDSTSTYRLEPELS